MADEAAARLAFLPTDVPALGRGHCQQRAHAGGGFAHRRFVCCKRSAIGSGVEAVILGPTPGDETIRVLPQTRQRRHPQLRPLCRQRQVGILRRGRSRFDRDLPPVCAKFHCGDLRDQRGDPLPHLYLRHGNADHAVTGDLDPRIEGHFSGPWRQRQLEAARAQHAAKRQPAACQRADYHPPPRQLHRRQT